MSNKSPVLFLKKPLFMGNLSSAHKILIERHCGKIIGMKIFELKMTFFLFYSLLKNELLGI